MTGTPDQDALAERFREITERSQRVAAEFAARHGAEAGGADPDPLGIGKAFLEMTARMMADPARMMTAQAELAQQYARLWQDTARRMMGGEPVQPVAEPEPGDRRFKDTAWRENFVFDFIKQSYLLSSRFLLGSLPEAASADRHEADKVAFYTRQFVDAMAPTNFAATNPKVLRETLDSNGENLLRGFENMLRDLEAGKGQLRIAQTDMSAFEVGRNVAVTPGKVVLRNDLMELIQYEPATETVHEVPLLIVPPWINKFYILDLTPENSFVRWAVEQGHTVFVISWVNPDSRLSDKAFEDYMAEGPLAALDAIERITGARRANAIGYCLGGTLLAVTLAWLAARGEAPIESAPYFASLVDFSEVGELGVFIDEEQVSALEARMDKAGGVLEGADMATTFNMLRANDLIWSFVINTYLLGRDPVQFELLFRIADSKRM
ncbi:MAG: class I poly(R)-hydroxyalkanoic acid synthase, partial [Alphaproteobacteria bacterium]|nr:class I poly(R)-hydroxyalkanoic acid synthase [Alphaproteobacteria bacterium]